MMSEDIRSYSLLGQHRCCMGDRCRWIAPQPYTDLQGVQVLENSHPEQEPRLFARRDPRGWPITSL